ncbi:hypothetical protein BVY01_01785 [bacterium I07]|nr:hypothetical protein BVY01_01785 [bacterium I07]
MIQKRNRIRVGTPLTPEMLDSLNALNPVAGLPENFDSRGDWEHTYRIWSCHGYKKSGNDDRGFLKLKRRLTNSGSVLMNVEQNILNHAGFLNTIKSDIECKDDMMATPLQWKIDSMFIGPDGKRIEDLGTRDRAKASDGVINMIRNGLKVQKRLKNVWTGDWCLPDVIQKLPFDETEPVEFDMMEEMSLLRSGQKLKYRGTQKAGVFNQNLHWFQQTGHGILPYDYWLDDRHRLLYFVTLSIAYVLDPEAETKFEKSLLTIDRGRG